MSEPVKITAFEDGPFKLENVDSITYCGNKLEASGELYICRCGQTKSAPFCDGTHNKVGFSGAREREGSKDIVEWKGKTISTFFNPNVCMHVFYCKPLKELRERELSGDTAAAAEIARVVSSCPSGALRYETHAQVDDAAQTGTTVEVIEGGELRIRGALSCENFDQLEGQDGQRLTLCRCGLSKNKPYCDGRHKARKDFK